VEGLLRKKVVMRIHPDPERTIPGRNYRMADKYLPESRFNEFRWASAVRGEKTFDQAQAFRDFLGSAFADKKEVLMSEMTNDGSVYCVLNLIASQEVIINLARLLTSFRQS
jgi:hypothetical protein